MFDKSHALRLHYHLHICINKSVSQEIGKIGKDDNKYCKYYMRKTYNKSFPKLKESIF
jgi:hypothetical protein